MTKFLILGLALSCLAGLILTWAPSTRAFIFTGAFVMFIFMLAIELDNLECGQ